MNFQSSKVVSMMAVLFIAALVVHGALAISFAVKGQYFYVVTFFAVFAFIGYQLRKAFEQLKVINKKMDSILSKDN